MENNPYSPPKARLDTGQTQQSGFYVVSLKKFTLLYFATLGLYSYYWFTVNWKAYKHQSGENIWPIPRGIFSIFFVHSLFSKIDAKRAENNVGYSWSPSSLATGFVVLSVLSSILNRLAFREIGSPVVDVLGLAILPGLYYLHLIPQKVVNACAGDGDGETNNDITIPNMVWIGIGLLWWLLVITGLLEAFGAISYDDLFQ